MLITSELLEQIELNQERHATYRDGYKTQAKILQLLYPNGIVGPNQVDADSAELDHTWAQAAMMFMMAAKMVRYAICVENGEAHHDSLRDLSVYATMLSKLDKDEETRSQNVRRAAVTRANAMDGETPPLEVTK